METAEGKTAYTEADLFHRPTRLMRIASMANILSWVVLIFVVLIFGVQMFSLIRQVIQVIGQYGFMDIAPAFVTPLMILFAGLFVTVILQGLSECIYVVMDVEENTRKA
jgi:hypothetical protein